MYMYMCSYMYMYMCSYVYVYNIMEFTSAHVVLYVMFFMELSILAR